MSCAGIWSEAPVASGDAAAMLAPIARLDWTRRALSDAAQHLAVAVATRPADEADALCVRLSASALVVCGDLRLHNAAELATALALEVRASNAAIVAAAYERWGSDFVRHLTGDFALILWDERERLLLLARDSGGACPLFYATTDTKLVFASGPPALLTVSGVSSRLHERAVVDYLAELPSDEERTLFAEIRRVPPGSCLIAKGSTRRLIRYFQPLEIAELSNAGDEYCARELREALREAVRCRLPPEGEVGVMLSGGLDSSSMALLARGALSHGSLHTFSAIFPDEPEADERSFQSEVVRVAGSRHHEVRPDPETSAGDFERLCRVFFEPGFIGPHWLAWAVTDLAARRGISRMLTGIDGDRVVSHGAGRFGDLAAAGNWRGLAAELAAVPDFGWGRRMRVASTQALLALLPTPFAAVLEAADPRRHLRFRAARSLIRSDVSRQHEVGPRIAALPLRARSTRLEHARSLLASDRNWDVELLEQLGNAFNVRFEQPFFDARVVSLCFSFPGSQKRQRGWSRYVLRNAMRELLPAAVVNRRTDASFDRPYWRWARRWLTCWPATPSELANISPYIDLRKLKPLLCDLPRLPDRGPVDLIWRCVILSRWLDARERIRTSPANISLPLSNVGTREGAFK